MAGMICTVKGCGHSTNDATVPQCGMTQCPGRTIFARTMSVRARWEYLVISPSGSDAAQIERRLSDLGSQGWELVAVTLQTHTSCMLYLKRAIT